MKKTISRQKIHFKDYLECIKKIKSFETKIACLTSKDHNITLNIVKKIAMSSFDSKRYIFDCGIHSVPFGSSFIPAEEETSAAACIYCKNPTNLKNGFFWFYDGFSIHLETVFANG